MDEVWLWLAVLIAAPVGSFLAVWAERTCAGRSLLAPSACSTCEARIAARDLIPVISFLLLRRRCRACRAPLPWRLMVAEVLAFAAALAAIAVTETLAEMALTLAFLWSLLALALTDLICLRLPDVMTAPLLAVGLGLAWVAPGRDLVDGLTGAAVGGAVLLALRLAYQSLRGAEGLGLGDVKLALGIGAALGATALPWVGLLASLSGLAAAALGLFGPTDRATPLPFGVFLCAAAAGLVVAAPWL
ncbi:prepilin peptidase [Marinovum sp.]|uniref:prepilin peptidase n=1 Tax=Marinovum sp. TaxID=2024839 RepID=UPI003A8D753A